MLSQGSWGGGICLLVDFFLFKVVNVLKQRKLCGHQIFIDSRNFHCKHNNIDTLKEILNIYFAV